MAVHNLFIDIDRAEAVIGASDSSIAALPKFVQEDTLNFRVWFLSGFSRISAYTRVPVAGLTVEMALGTRVGNSTLYYTQQFTWMASNDLAQPYFAAALPMNTPAIAAVLGSDSNAPAWFEVKLIDAGLPRTVLSKLVTVRASVIKDGGLPGVATPTPLSAETAMALFLQREIPCTSGNPLVLVNTNTGQKTAIWPNDDGTLHSELLT